MKLRNKKTGEILGLGSLIIKNPNRINCESIINYDSLAELNEDWEDYKEKEYFYLDMDGDIRHTINQSMVEYSKEIGNYFETREEAEKAVEKLKAWKRLKDSGFRFNDWCYAVDGNRENGAIPIIIKAECKKDTSLDDLDLLFSGEDD